MYSSVPSACAVAWRSAGKVEPTPAELATSIALFSLALPVDFSAPAPCFNQQQGLPLWQAGSPELSSCSEVNV